MTVFSELFQAHSRDVYRFALFLSGDHDLAEDIVSETFIRVWHARDRLDLTTVKAYLLAIARNLFLDERRRAAILLRAEEGLSYDEIGALLGLTPIAARVKVHRARAKLNRAAGAAAGPGMW